MTPVPTDAARARPAPAVRDDGCPGAAAGARHLFGQAVERAVRRRLPASDERAGPFPREIDPPPDLAPPQAPLAAHLPARTIVAAADADAVSMLAAAPAAAPLPACSQAGAPPAARGDLGASEFAASLARLQMPAGPDGAQRWQFSFADPAGPLAAVSLTTAAPGAPWQLQLRANERDRVALTQRLDELRGRLHERHATIGDVRLEGPADERGYEERR